MRRLALAIASIALGAPSLSAATYDYSEVAPELELDQGGPLPGIWACDDCAASVTLPFPFPYYGSQYTAVHVSSNGLISLAARDASYQDSVASLSQKLAIAPLWDDWDLRCGVGTVAYRAHSDRVVFTWAGVPRRSCQTAGGTSATFQAVLHADGRIRFNYGSNTASIDATVGISERQAATAIAFGVRSSHFMNSIVFAPSQAPLVADAGPDVAGDEGDAIPLGGTAPDEDASEGTTYAWSYEVVGASPGATCTFSAPTSPATTITCDDSGSFRARLTATRGAATASDAAEVVVRNVPPVLLASSPADGAAYGANLPVIFSARIVDPGRNDTHTCSVVWGGQTISTFAARAGECVEAVAFPRAGVYEVGIAVVDDDLGAASTTARVLVHDPSAGFVTGGGWIGSPPGGAARREAGAVASFGLVARYPSGSATPAGETELHVPSAGLHFRSAAYDWLVVDGARALLAGDGTVNGVPGWRFLVAVVDGRGAGAGAVDRLRIRLWDAAGALTYDSSPGDVDDFMPGAAIQGSIVVHAR